MKSNLKLFEVLLPILIAAFWANATLASTPKIQIKPAFLEYFVGEAVIVAVTITAAPGEPVSVIKLDRIYGYPGAFVSTVLDPDGSQVLGGPPTLRPPPYIALDHVVGLAGGQTLESRISLLTPGRHVCASRTVRSGAAVQRTHTRERSTSSTFNRSTWKRG